MNKKTILITGSSRGIGREIAMTFARQNWQVVINGKSQTDQLARTEREINALGADFLAYAADVGDYSQCQELFAAAERRFGHLDVLVNNAGISAQGLFQEVTPAEWDDLLRTNLSSVFYCSKLAVPGMLENKAGKIINISSVWGICGASCEAAYSAAKGGVNAFTKALAKELAPSNIQVNAIACGAIDTAMNSWLDEQEKSALREEIPAGRMGSAAETAQLVFALAAGHPYLTGQIIQLDGGWL